MIFMKQILLLSLLAVGLLAQARPVQSEYKSESFTYQEVMIPMRDGVCLQTVLRTPKKVNGPIRFLFAKTPYGVPENTNSLTESGLFDDLISDGYIFVSQNIRGRFKSEGIFVMQCPPRDKNDPKSIDEATDVYDTIDWLLENVPNNNGRVGMWGISYPGWMVTRALLDPDPALKAASEQASPDDMFINDDSNHNGVFRLSYGFEYSALLLISSTTLAQVDSPAKQFMRAMKRSMATMDHNMAAVPMTGAVDHDFAAMMIPHHNGAIDMATAELRFGKDPVLRRMAQEILVEQQSEIDAMNLWITKQH